MTSRLSSILCTVALSTGLLSAGAEDLSFEWGSGAPMYHADGSTVFDGTAGDIGVILAVLEGSYISLGAGLTSRLDAPADLAGLSTPGTVYSSSGGLNRTLVLAAGTISDQGVILPTERISAATRIANQIPDDARFYLLGLVGTTLGAGGDVVAGQTRFFAAPLAVGGLERSQPDSSSSPFPPVWMPDLSWPTLAATGTINVDTPVVPTGLSANGTLGVLNPSMAFQYSASSGTCELQLARDQQFNDVVFQTLTTIGEAGEQRLRGTQFLPEADYHWRVRCHAPSGDAGDWVNGPPLIVSYRLQLEAGWNLVSMPNRSEGIAEILENLADVTPIWYWDEDAKRFRAHSGDEPLLPSRGYWLHASTPVDLPASRGTVVADEVVLVDGWNMIGPLETAELGDYPGQALRPIWEWSDTQLQPSDEPLDLFRGYWIFYDAP